jgi:predicted ATPase
VSDPTFVGRERELAKLQAFLDKTIAGHVQVCFVTGEAGSGKSALIYEFARRAQESEKNLVVAVGNCNAQMGLGAPYFPFLELLTLLTGCH